MSLEEKLLIEFKSLTDDKKKEVIDFVESLKFQNRKIENIMDEIIDENHDALEEIIEKVI